MRYSIEIKKFLYSQYFFAGLRIAIGISLPAVVMLFIFHDRDLGFTIATGALGASIVDMPGPLKYKRNEMLACTVIGSLAALATGIATASPLALWLTVTPLTFILSMTVVYGNRWPQISFVTLFMMVMTLEAHYTPLQALVNALWLFGGGLWYTYWSTFVSRWKLDRLEQQALAESIFATADYLLARADFYDLDTDIDECYRNLVAKQVAAIERQDAAREMVLRNLPKRQAGGFDARRTALFNLFINTVDLHESFVGAHSDYPLMRTTFGRCDLMVFFRDLIRKAARDLHDVGLAVLLDRRSRRKINLQAELRAIEAEIETMRKKDMPALNPAAYSSIVTTYRRVWGASRLIDKMHRNTGRDTAVKTTELQLDQALAGFLSSRKISFMQIFSNLNMSSPSFRHALRVTGAVALGLWLGRLLPLTNAYWIVVTTLIILKPGYSLTKQRNAQRLIGTVIGCSATVVLVIFIKEPHILLAIMFASMVMCYSLVLFNYTASVVFTSAFVLLLFQLLAPSGIRLIGERAIDTFVGGAIAIAFSHLFPYWEYKVMGKFVKAVISASVLYLDAGLGMLTQAAAPRAPAQGAGQSAGQGTAQGTAQRVLAHTPSGQPGPPLPAWAADPDSDFRYRLARRDVHVAFANLSQAFQRMMLEPKAQQRFVPELNDLLMQSHALAAQITSATPLLGGLRTTDDLSLARPLEHALGVVREHLEKAQNGVAPQGDHLEATKALTRTLDDMVVAAEQAPQASAETVQELKLLAHQCKQMFAAAYLIRKDASVITL
jgi:uncharacterized membrane protein YccC